MTESDQSRVEVLLFTSPTCPHCPRAKAFGQDYFKDRDDVDYQNLDTHTPAGQQEAMKYGIQGVPTFVLKGPGYPQPIGQPGTPDETTMGLLIDLAKGDKTLEQVQAEAAKAHGH